MSKKVFALGFALARSAHAVTQRTFTFECLSPASGPVPCTGVEDASCPPTIQLGGKGWFKHFSSITPTSGNSRGFNLGGDLPGPGPASDGIVFYFPKFSLARYQKDGPDVLKLSVNGYPTLGSYEEIRYDAFLQNNKATIAFIENRIAPLCYTAVSENIPRWRFPAVFIFKAEYATEKNPSDEADLNLEWTEFTFILTGDQLIWHDGTQFLEFLDLKKGLQHCSLDFRRDCDGYETCTILNPGDDTWRMKLRFPDSFIDSKPLIYDAMVSQIRAVHEQLNPRRRLLKKHWLQEYFDREMAACAARQKS